MAYLYLIFSLLGLSLFPAAYALEASVKPQEVKTSSILLKNTVKNKILRQVLVCHARLKFYAPEHPSADADGCADN